MSSPDSESMTAWSRLQTASDISSFSMAMRLQIRSMRTACRMAVVWARSRNHNQPIPSGCPTPHRREMSQEPVLFGAHSLGALTSEVQSCATQYSSPLPQTRITCRPSHLQPSAPMPLFLSPHPGLVATAHARQGPHRSQHQFRPLSVQKL